MRSNYAMQRSLDIVDQEAAHSALMESLARPCGTPCTWRDDRDAYIGESKADFLAHLIEPRLVEAYQLRR
jgi:hypothetical protein